MNTTLYIIQCISQIPFDHVPNNPVQHTLRGYEVIYGPIGGNLFNDINSAYGAVTQLFHPFIAYVVEEYGVIARP